MLQTIHAVLLPFNQKEFLCKQKNYVLSILINKSAVMHDMNNLVLRYEVLILTIYIAHASMQTRDRSVVSLENEKKMIAIKCHLL